VSGDTVTRTVRVTIDSSSGKVAMSDMKSGGDAAAASMRSLSTATNTIQEQYRRLASTLDPVIAGHIKYENAQHTLAEALNRGIISQTQYNAQLAAAKSKFEDAGQAAGGFAEALSGKIKDALLELAAMAVGFLTVQQAVEQLKQSVEDFGKFQDSLLAIAANTGAAADQMRLLSDASKDIGANTKFGADQAADGLKVLTKAGFSVSDSIGQLPQVEHLAIIGTIGLADAADNLAKTLERFNLPASESQHVVDTLATVAAHSRVSISALVDTMKIAGPTAGAMGLQFNDVAATLGVMAKNDAALRQMGGAVVTALSALSIGSKKVTDDLGRLNLKLADVSPQTHSLSQIIITLARAGLDATTAFDIFGKQAGGAILSLTSHVPQLLAMQEAIKGGSGAGEHMAAIMESGVQGSLDRAAQAAKEVRLEIGEGMAPAIQVAADDWARFARESLAAGNALGTTLGSAVGTLSDVLLLLARNIDLVKSGLEIFLLLKAAEWVNGFAISVTALIAKLTAATVAEEAAAGSTVAIGGALVSVTAETESATSATQGFLAIGITPLAGGLLALAGVLLYANEQVKNWGATMQAETERMVKSVNDHARVMTDLKTKYDALTSATKIQAEAEKQMAAEGVTADSPRGKAILLEQQLAARRDLAFAIPDYTAKLTAAQEKEQSESKTIADLNTQLAKRKEYISSGRGLVESIYLRGDVGNIAAGGGDPGVKALDQQIAEHTNRLKEAQQETKRLAAETAGLGEALKSLPVPKPAAPNPIIPTTKVNTSEIDKANAAVRAYAEGLSDLNTKARTASDGQEKLLASLGGGIIAYETEQRAQQRQAAIDAETLALTKLQRAEIDKLTDAHAKLLQQHKYADAANVAAKIKTESAAFDEETAKLTGLVAKKVDDKQATADGLAILQENLQFSIASREAEAALADAKAQSTQASRDLSVQLEIEAAFRKQLPKTQEEKDAAAARIIGARTFLEFLKSTTAEEDRRLAAEKQIAAIIAKGKDNHELIEATQKYGASVAAVLQKYGLLDDASKALLIHEQAIAIQKKDGGILADIEAELTAYQQRADAAGLTASAEERTRAAAHELRVDLASAFDTLSTSLGGSSTLLGKLTADMGKLVTAIDTAATASSKMQKALGAAAAINIGATLLTDLGVGATAKTGGASALGGRLEGNYAGVGGIVGTIIGGIIGAIIGAFAGGVGAGPGAAAGSSIGGAIGSILGSLISKAGDSASASLTASGNIIVGETSRQLNGAVKDALTNIFKGLQTEMASLGLFLEGIPLIDIKVRDNIIRVVVGEVVRTFSSMQDAISFGISEAVKQAATSGGHLPPEVLEALKKTTATDMTALQSDIDFAMKIANYGVPQVAQALSKAVSDFFVEMQRDVSLGIDTTKSIAQFALSIQQEKDKILGINRNLSPADQMKADAAAFNQRATLIKAQEALDVADLKLKEVDLEQKIAILKAEQLATKGHIDLAKARVQTDVAVDGASVNSLGALQAALDATLANIAAAQAVIDSITLISDKELADALKRLGKVGKGTGGGADPAQEVRDALEQARIARLGEEGKALADLATKYADLNKKAGKHADLLAQLAVAQQQEINVLTQQEKIKLAPFAGDAFSGGRSAYAQTLADEEAQQKDLLSVAGQLALSVRGVTAAFTEMHRILGLQVASDLGIESAALVLKYQTEGQAVDFLKTHMDELGVSADQLAGYMSELSDATELSIFGKIQGYITDEQTLAAYKEVQYELDIARAKEELALAYTAGTLTLEAYNRLGKIIYSLPDTMPAAAASASKAAATQSSAAQTQLQAAQANQAAADKLTQWQQSLLTNPETSPLTPRAQVAESKRQLEDLLAKGIGGDTTARDQFTQQADAYLKLFSDTFGRTGAFAAEVLSVSAEADRLKATLTGNPAQNLALFPTNAGYAAGGSGSDYKPPTVSGSGIVPPPPLHVVRDTGDQLDAVKGALGKDGDIYKVIRQGGIDAATNAATTIDLHKRTVQHLKTISDTLQAVQSSLNRNLELLRPTGGGGRLRPNERVAA